jgi:hypothetical protein
MPTLSKAKQKTVGAVESSGDFPVLPAGRYLGTLKEVNADKNGQPLVGRKSGKPYWQWVFSDITSLEDGQVYAGHQFVNTSLTDDADWKMKEMFDAFGFTVDSDTDEMIGGQVILHIVQREIEEGDRKGEMGNNVRRVAPYDAETPGDWDGE